ncbi:uncharacterized protein LOC113309718 [Papaver somniferum]|uniref:uncharacterized protein LOC113309718 n=1 Tax=Papaver somniferum TaxID=3469 RepID=UPI000E70439D|nr:uncharacterized protein LOC113309718 [Papaver somniferum]XP_026414011.1 uncharacterized protein LOC113309718 [Papaver somniferum]XP_026414012.1 uncharacterized protein LOC113309718 [Papaver somniferum]XP_026414013.1 uncharacterized protein LOC113309718 [Papaver somniferum]XP_026414014.1 uncharacterized protein LOC113309718 [Papaver somniferum]XP_026414015.1 uncharacterized protein LOC113309718 [Papaver somniferum]
MVSRRWYHRMYTMEVSKALKIIQSDGPSRGLHLNVTKTKIFWPSFDPRREAAGVFPPNIGKPSAGVKLLGGPVSLGLQYCSVMVHSRVGKTLQLMDKMKQLQDLQSELLLLRNCSGVSRLYFTLRITTPSAIQTAAAHFDKHLLQYLRQIVVGDEAGFGLIQHLVTLPLKVGGLGIHTMSNTGQFCFLASCAQTQHLQTTILKQLSVPVSSLMYQQAVQTYNQVCGLSDTNFSINDAAPRYMKSLAVIYFGVVKEKIATDFSLSDRDLTLWHYNIISHPMDFLKAIPISGLNQAIVLKQFRSVLSYRFGIPLFGKDNTCSSCNRHMEVFRDHALHCASDIRPKLRHNLVRNVLADMCYKAGVAARKEAVLGFLSDNATSLRPADILVYTWEDGKDVCMDIIGVSPFTSASTRDLSSGHAISAAIACKRTKYLDKCLSHGYSFGVLAFSIMGALGEQTLFSAEIKKLSSQSGCKS